MGLEGGLNANLQHYLQGEIDEQGIVDHLKRDPEKAASNLTSLLNLINEPRDFSQTAAGAPHTYTREIHEERLNRLKNAVDTALKNLPQTAITPSRVVQQTYEQVVDNFLDKLFAPGESLNKSRKQIKKDILENNRLDLSHSSLRRLPPEIGYLSNLQKLFLQGTPITSLPPEVGNLRNLKDLDLHSTRLTTLPSEIRDLSNLQIFALHDTPITSLPPEIGNLRNLKELWLGDTSITSLPSTVRNLTHVILLDLENAPISAQGSETTWGRQELRAHFRDRVNFGEPIVAMPAGTTKEKVYQELDSQPTGINREQIKNTKIPEIPGKAFEDGHEFLFEFNKVLSKLNFDHEKEAVYISYELLAGDYAREGSAGSNWEKIRKDVVSRVTGYFKTLYGMPLEPGESGGWQMYDDKIPALKKALSFIVTQLATLEDEEQRASLFIQLVDGILHCPTGQSEGVDTISLALLEQKTARSSDLPKIVSDAFAIRKNAFFKTAVLTKGSESSQNVHLISTYQGRLKDEIGLSNVLEYNERMGILGSDPYSNNPANVLQIFYSLVTPPRLVDWLVEKTQSRQDAQLRLELEKLQSQQVETSAVSAPLAAMKEKLTLQLQDHPEMPHDEKQALQARIEGLDRMISAQKPKALAVSPEERTEVSRKIALLKSQIRANARFKPITTQIIIDHLRNNKIVDTEQPNWWKEYFSEDPVAERTSSLTREGALKLLVQLGYIRQTSP